MAPAGSTPGSSPVTRASSSGIAATPASQALPPPRSWKGKFQKHVNSWIRQNSSETHVEDASSAARSPTNATAKSTNVFSDFRRRINNPTASSIPNPSLQSESSDSLTSASLFSRNSYPSIFSNGTDATSVSGISTTCGLTCSVDGGSVKAYKRMKSNVTVYLARDDIEVPLDVLEQWETSELERLKTDLSEVIMEIYRKGIDRESKRRKSALSIPIGLHEYDVLLELRMSGRTVSRDAKQVTIGPSIWVVCGSTWACKEISAAMEQITWPTLPVEIHEGRVPIPSGAEGKIDIEKLDLSDGCHLGDGRILYIHIEDPSAEATSCGLLLCVTMKDGDNYSHCFSRVGGLVLATNTLKSSRYGVSTAHGMWDNPWWHRQLKKRTSLTPWDCQSIASNNDGSDDVDNDVYPPSPLFSVDSEFGEGYRDPQAVTSWRNVTPHGLFSFLGTSVTVDNQLQLHTDSARRTDHALIDLECLQDISSSWSNKYHPRGAPPTPESAIDVTTHMSNRDLTKGEVDILCQADSPITGNLLPASTCLAIAGRMFTLRKLKTSVPLARGVSGSWVVRDAELCGMVIAVSTPEQYAYMMRAEDLISNLEASSPSIETIEVFNSRDEKAVHEHHKAFSQRYPQRLDRQLSTTVASSALAVPEQCQRDSIRRTMSARVGSLGTSSKSQDPGGNDLRQRYGTKPRRTRSVYSRLSNRFSNKVEEIIQPACDFDTKSSSKDAEVRSPSKGNRTPSYRPIQAKRRSVPANTHRLRTPLEPISEAISESDTVSISEYTFLRSTAYNPTSTFRHADIRMHTSDLMREPDLDVDEECAEYDHVLRKIVRYWQSDNYESQQGGQEKDQEEQEAEEVEELLDWWESWGIEDPCLNTGEVEEAPPSPSCALSDDVPEISYSDTTSEDSISSCQPDSVDYAHLPKYSYPLGDIEQLSIAEKVWDLGELAKTISASDEACRVDCM
ncbi:hypothetical protein NPX13_g4660 [Xylaria arbuscula]|uniref:Uncharacterized protein n=1 Tax=Xylaria arbuscula TaxID=114810 RepID=A0A9W8NG25_9PEZI|nr:hypothetical protein NPX13_g4660 [Xylaria arbuscula]